MYYLGWIVLVGVSLALSLASFAWALRSGQFADQGRARYLPLRDEPSAPPGAAASRRPAEVYALAAVSALVAAGLATPLVLWWLGR
ncbi:MAG: hypothetical protein HZB55_08265 [Deltaproteobacteria bacterium]|nr:hypothetical protein [Deltaproteobacteria bacterium]